MMGHFFLAWRYVCFHRWRTLLLLVCLTLTAVLPISIRLLVTTFEQSLWSRSEKTAMVVGAKGSRFDLVLHALYFRARTPELISMADLQEVADTQFGQVIPLHAQYRARGFPVVGTSLDYLDFRNLDLAQGRAFIHLGECVLGSAVARELELTVGDTLMSDPENVFNIAGEYPLKMQVAGILEASESVDDRAVFVDTKTAWIIAGIGHGHQALTETDDESLLLKKEGQNLVANADLMPYMEVTAQNRASFHFHADPEDRPLSALLVKPFDQKSSTLLRGRYEGGEARLQVLRPRDIITEMIAMVGRLQQFLNVNFMVVAIVSFLFLCLVVLLSLRLREKEIETLYLLGCRRGTVLGLVAMELGLVFLGSLVLTGVLVFLVQVQFESWLLRIFA